MFRFSPKNQKIKDDDEFKPNTFTKKRIAAAKILVNQATETQEEEANKPDYLNITREQFLELINQIPMAQLQKYKQENEVMQMSDDELVNGVISTISSAVRSLHTSIQHLHNSVNKEKQQKTMFKVRLQAVQSELDNLRQERQPEEEENNDPISELIDDYNDGDKVSGIRALFRLHLRVEYNNRNRPPNHKVYPEEIRPFYVLLSFAGHYWYDILKKALDLPSFSTVKKYRKAMLKEIGIDKFTCFDGSEEIIRIM